MWSAENTLNEELYELGEGVKKAWTGLEEFPLWMRSLGVLYANGAKGMKVHRKIKSISDEMNTSELTKLKKYTDGLKDIAVGFNNGFINRLSPEQKQLALKLTGDTIREMFEAGNRQAAIRRHMIRNNVSISDLRRIADPEVKHIRSTLTSDMKYAMDRNMDLPEDQLLELAMGIMAQGE